MKLIPVLVFTLLAFAAQQTSVRAESPSKPLFVAFIGGFDSEPTADQLAGKAQRGVGNSGMFQLAGDLREDGVASEYFNWNGSTAGKINEQPAPLSKGIAQQLRKRHAEHPNGKLTARDKPLGFWNLPTGGLSTPHDKWAKELLAAQQSGDEIGDQSRLVLNAAEIKRQYPEDAFPGHSAWNAWPWKLHRIQNKNEVVKWELYNLADDPQEATDVSKQESDRLQRMRSDLEAWLAAVARSLNGKDYAAK